MNELCRKVFDGEVLPPGGGVINVVAYPHPLRTDRLAYPVDAGPTIAEIASAIDGPCIAVLFGDHSPELVIPQDRWHCVRPKPGTTLVLKAILQGKNARSIAMIGVAVAAIAAAVFLPFLIGPMLAGTFGALAAPIASMVAGAAAAAISIGGMMLVNALIPLPKPAVQDKIDDGSLNFNRETVYSIAGATNQSRPFGAVPVVLGRHRIYPPYAAAPYTELVGNDQYLRLLFCVGYGPLSIDDMKIGETPLGNFSGVTVEVRNGYLTDAPITLYPSDVAEQQLSILLVGITPVNLVTAPNTDNISIDITLPNGLFQIDTSTGKHTPFPMTVVAYAVPVGGGATIDIGALNFTQFDSTARFGMSRDVPRGQYTVTVGKSAADANSSNIADQVVWSSLRSTRFEHPVAFDAPLALVALRIKATGQLSGIVSDFNCIASSRIQAWSGTAWVPDTVSSNPADLCRSVLQHPANKRPVPNAGIDLETLQAFADYCADREFTYDAVIESAQSIFATITAVASAGRGVPVFLDGRWGFGWDKFDSPIVQHFTPRNSSGFSGSRIYRRMPHGFRVKFVDEDSGWAVNERLVFDDGFTEASASLYESIEFPGVTDADLIWKHARYRLAEAKLRPETYQLSVDFEHLRCNRLDRVRVSHDVALIGQTAGRVKDVAGAVVTLDERVVMEPGRDYGVRFRLANGDTLVRDVTFVGGEHNSFTLSGAGSVPAIGDLAMFGERGQETGVFRVRSIEPQADLRARLTLVDDAPDIDLADAGGIPPFDSHITGPVDLAHLPPQDLHVAEIIDGAGGAKQVRARFSWRALRAANVVSFEAQRRNDAGGDWESSLSVAAPQNYVDFPDTLLGTWSFRVRSIFDDGGFSDWAQLSAKDITGVTLSSPLPDVTYLHEVYRTRVINIDWTEVVDFREPFYEIRKGPTWESALIVATLAHPPFPALGNDTYWVAAVASPISGLTVYSANPQSITIGGAQLVQNVVVEIDEVAEGWLGTFTGSVAVDGDTIRTGGGGDILTEPDFLAIPDILTFGGGAGGTYEIPPGEIFDLGRPCEAAICITLAAGGSSIGGDILSEPDFLALPDLLESGGAAQLVEVFAEIAVAVDDPAGGFTFGPWERWSSGVKTARAVKVRLILNVLNPNVFAYVTEFSWTIDVPDRLDHYSYTSNTAGDTIVFTPDLAASPAAFNGGPNGSSVPFIAYALRSGDANDRVEVSSLTAASVFIRVFSGAGAGSGVSRVIEVLAQGY